MAKRNRGGWSRRDVLKATGTAALAASLGGTAAAAKSTTIRWGIVGTGYIANSMAPRIAEAANAELQAVSSRSVERAQAFADRYTVPVAFGSWQEMLRSEEVDAIYIATPTSVREEIGVAAAEHGKHVLGEKPFASLASLQRIVAACREHGVGFMDATHFSHHPRTEAIRAEIRDRLQQASLIESAFQFPLSDTKNIRLDPDLEPLGAIGDVGWYNMRALAEYVSPDASVTSVAVHARRHAETGAVVFAAGLVVFSDGTASTFACGFDCNAFNADMRIAGPGGELTVDDFPGHEPDGSAVYTAGTPGKGNKEDITVPATGAAATQMFEDFAAMTGSQALFEKSVAISERTQAWLDLVWEAAS
ncbi:MAG TPA: Gfo/Idh/MocA family oxidoreductase [Woeseiaceae bacterium]|jgi:predicted dehydrogenase|nr:Gfo/Idh/MocA family oxidoreductase [Woeseiaceae bacterium]